MTELQGFLDDARAGLQDVIPVIDYNEVPDDPGDTFYKSVLILARARAFLDYLWFSCPQCPVFEMLSKNEKIMFCWDDEFYAYIIEVADYVNDDGGILQRLARAGDYSLGYDSDFEPITELERTLTAIQKRFERTPRARALRGDEIEQAYVKAEYFIKEMEL